METRRWFNMTHPQMLQGAQLLLYVNAAFGLLNLLGAGRGTASGLLFLLVFVAPLVAVAGAPAAFGIANDKKWGWQLGIVVAVAALVFTLLPVVLGVLPVSSFSLLLSLMFEVLLIVLLLHTATKGYVKIWFK